MHFDESIIPSYLEAVNNELSEAIKGKGIFADHNGVAYLSEALEILKESKKSGFDHSVLRPQVWNALTTLTPDVLRNPKISEQDFGKILKLFWSTQLTNFVSNLQLFEDESVRANVELNFEWINFILSFHKLK